ncbi:MAG: serine/threonine-protein kinase [Myxococcota bacterium]
MSGAGNAFTLRGRSGGDGGAPGGDSTFDLSALTATGTWGDPASPGAGPAWIGQRYRLGRVLGTGGTASVVEAEDQLTGERVAVKLMVAMTSAETARVRREVTALRRVRLPGCVRLRDDGVFQGAYYVVMDLVEGRPFPGGPVPMPWPAIAPRLDALLHVLSRVHARGLAHLDLKPGNVLVGDARDDVCVLDFGIASGPAVSAVPEGEVRYTPRYAAPERVAGQPGDARTDLWGAAAMALEAVTGQAPHRVAAPLDALLRAGVAPEAAAVLAGMLAADPAARPSEAEVLAVLSPVAADPLAAVALPTEAVDEAALWALFAGPDAFLHLREDGAAALFARTQGEPAAVRRVLGEWVAGGLAEVRDGLVVMDRPTLDGLLAPEVRTVEAIDALLDRGETARAAAVIEPLLAEVRAAGAREAEAALLHRLARSAVTPAAPTYALDAVLYEIGRSGLTDDVGVRATEALVRCELAVRRKQVEEARGLLETVFGGVDGSLESWAWYLRVRTGLLEGPEAHERALAALGEAAKQLPALEQHYHFAIASAHYQRGRYAMAAEAYERSASMSTTTSTRMLALLGAAGAWLEVPDLGRVNVLGMQVQELATSGRQAAFEVKATWLVRAAAYRSGAALCPDPDLVAMAGIVSSEGSLLLALNEAAVAWRRGEHRAAAELAAIAQTRSRALARSASSMLASALLMASCAAIDAREVDALEVQIRSCSSAELRAQGWALLALRSSRPEHHEHARRAAMKCERSRWSQRLDVLSIDECVAT